MISTESRQKVMKTLGDYGCYFLSVVHLAEELNQERIDAIPVFVDALNKKWIDSEASMLEPSKILSVLTRRDFSIHKEEAGYQVRDGEYEVLLFENGNYRHFVLGNGNGQIAYDPLGFSQTAAQGKLIGKRIFTQK